MRSQLSLSSIGCIFGQVFSRPKSLSILFVTLALAACGQEDITISSDLPKDSVQPSMKSLLAVNKCNYTEVVGWGQTVLIDLNSSESTYKPIVTINGEDVSITGQASSWRGEIVLSKAPADYVSNLKEFQKYEITNLGVFTFSTANIDFETGIIELIAADSDNSHGLLEGDEVTLNKTIGEDVEGLTNTTYFVEVVDEKLIKLKADSSDVDAIELKKLASDASEYTLTTDYVSEWNTYLSKDLSDYAVGYVFDATDNPNDAPAGAKARPSNTAVSDIISGQGYRITNMAYNTSAFEGSDIDFVNNRISLTEDTQKLSVDEEVIFNHLSGDAIDGLTDSVKYLVATVEDSDVSDGVYQITLKETDPDSTILNLNEANGGYSLTHYSDVQSEWNSYLGTQDIEYEVGDVFTAPVSDNSPSGGVVVSTVSEGLNVPVNISMRDNSGNNAEPIYTLNTIEGVEVKELQFCEGDCPCFPTDISGDWRLAQKAGAYGVGRAEGSIGDWSSSDFSLSQRDCQFDDSYSFQAANPIYPASGVFTQDMGESTWFEPWQPAANPLGYEHCDTPYAPFNGSTENMSYKWDVEAGTLTLYGLGAHIGLPRVANLVENTGEDIESVTYTIETASANFIALNILSGGPSPWWHFELERVTNADGTPVSDDSSDDNDDSNNDGDGDGDGDQTASEQTDYSADGPNVKGPFDMTSGFGSPLLPTVAGNGDLFSVPAASIPSDENPDAYVGFASQANGEFPLTFGTGGSIIFYGSVPAGQVSDSASVRFKLENQPVDSEVGDVSVTEPSYTTESVIISGATPGLYSFNVPAQLTYTFSNIIMYIDTPDVEVRITDVAAMVTPAAADNGDSVGPFDMTMQFGDGVVSGDLGEFFTNDSSLDFGYSGFATATTDLFPLTFGDGGTITFTAAVPAGQATTDAIVKFKFEKEASENGDASVTEPSCTSTEMTVSGSSDTVYSLDIPVQGDRSFSNFVMYVETLDTDVKIGNVMVSTTASSDAAPVDCGSSAIMYGEKGPFDMTGAYGDAVIEGDNGDLFKVPSDGGNGYAGYANQGEAKNLYPLTFGDGGTLTFTASIPENQAATEADVVFMFEKQESESGSFCETNPRYETLPQTVSGSSDLTYTIEIPSQGANTFSSFIMRLDDEDVQVKISDVMVTTTAPAEGEPTVPAACAERPKPSQFLDESGVNTAGYFTGVYGGENGGSNTLQNGDVFTFPADSASYGGFANDNADLYPITFNGFLNGSPLFTFCASADSVANVSFTLENNPHPANGTVKQSGIVEIPDDGEIRAYTTAIILNTPVQAWNSFLMHIVERDTPVTVGKIKANWNGNNSPDLTGYCDDFTPVK